MHSLYENSIIGHTKDNKTIVLVSGRDLSTICNQDFDGMLGLMLGYYSLDYLARIDNSYNYLLLLDVNGKIIGQRSFIISSSLQYRALSVSIAKPYRNKGYGNELLHCYFGVLSSRGVTVSSISNYSEDGELYLKHHLPTFEKQYNMKIVVS